MVLRVGLTGGIASGKSTVMKVLHDNHVKTIDADRIVDDLYKNDPDLSANIRQEFGDDVFMPSGQVDRKKLGGIVFADPARRKKLESWIHPKVREQVVKFFDANKNEKLAVAEIPLLFESQLEAMFDRIWLVKVSLEQQIQRLMQRNQFTRDEALARITSQMSLAEKEKKSHVVIDNSGTPDETRTYLEALLGRL